MDKQIKGEQTMKLEEGLKIMERFTAYALSMGFGGGLIHMAVNSISVPSWYWGVFGAIATWAGIPIAFNGIKVLKRSL